MSPYPGALPGEKMWGEHTWKCERKTKLALPRVRGQSTEVEKKTSFCMLTEATNSSHSPYLSNWGVNLQRWLTPYGSPPPSKTSLDLFWSQEHPPAKVGWTCPPQSTKCICPWPYHQKSNQMRIRMKMMYNISTSTQPLLHNNNQFTTTFLIH